MSHYDSKGYQRVNIVDGDTYTGLYSNDGAFNGVLDDENSSGLYHSCGAFNVTAVYEPDEQLPLQANNGFLRVVETTDGYVIYKEPITYLPPEE